MTEQGKFQGKFSFQNSINQVNDGIQNKMKIGDFVLNMLFRKSSDVKKSVAKTTKNKKITKIKETIFDINKNKDGLFDINIFGQLLDLLNNYCKKKEEEKNENINKNKNENESKVDVDENDKCFRFSPDDLDDYIYSNTKLVNKNKKTKINNVINNIFNSIFEK